MGSYWPKILIEHDIESFDSRGGKRLHSQLPSECDYLQRVLEFMAIILLKLSRSHQSTNQIRGRKAMQLSLLCSLIRWSLLLPYINPAVRWYEAICNLHDWKCFIVHNIELSLFLDRDPFGTSAGVIVRAIWCICSTPFVNDCFILQQLLLDIFWITAFEYITFHNFLLSLL